MTDGIERRVLNDADVRAKGADREDSIGQIEGYAAVFNSPSVDMGFREIIRKGAFDRALANGGNVVARIEHMGGTNVIGRTTNQTLHLSVDDRGLKYVVDLPDTSVARDLLSLVRRGDINKSSFAFSIPDWENGQEWDRSTDPPTRELFDLDLHDVAPVDAPAYESTLVSARSAAQKTLILAELEWRKAVKDELAIALRISRGEEIAEAPAKTS